MADLVLILAVLGSLITSIAGFIAPIAGYDVLNATSAVQLDGLDTTPINIGGSVQTVRNDLDSTHPDLIKLRATTTPQSRPTATITLPLDGDPVQPTPSGQVHCWTYPNVTQDWAMYSVDYLLVDDGSTTVDAGPYECTRVTCQHQAAIWWCNDNDHGLTFNNERIAWSAYDIASQCIEGSEWSYELPVSGQNFYPDGWNVILRHDDVNC